MVWPDTFRVPVKLAAEEMVWPFTVPEVILPKVAAVAKRLVVDAVVEKRLVVVAWVPVAFTKVKFCKVEDPFTKRLAAVAKLLMVTLFAKVALELPSIRSAETVDVLRVEGDAVAK